MKDIEVKLIGLNLLERLKREKNLECVPACHISDSFTNDHAQTLVKVSFHEAGIDLDFKPPKGRPKKSKK